jgi:hypothetical protein
MKKKSQYIHGTLLKNAALVCHFDKCFAAAL